MKINAHKLVDKNGKDIYWDASPNYTNKDLSPKYLVMHYTAGASFSSSVDWLKNKNASASAHVVISRNGDIAQLVKFDQRAWHAGQSRWRGVNGLNKYSIGIELDNAGPLKQNLDGQTYRSAFGRDYPETEVIMGEHQHGSEYEYWHKFPAKQIQTAIDVASLIVEKYELIDVIGHDDIAPGRKLDPGPAFPLDSFRSAVMGRKADDLEKGEVKSPLNIRSGPGLDYPTIASPLMPGTKLLIRMRMSSWLAVDVIRDRNPDISGWVHGDYVIHS